jgi:predicted PurR-regulated permease PerM
MDQHANPDFVVYLNRAFLWRVFAIAAVLMLIWYAGNVLLVAFAGILFAVLLRAITRAVQRLTHWGPRQSYGAVLFVVIALSVTSVCLLGPRVVDQAGEIANVIPQSLQRFQEGLNRYDWGRDLTNLADRSVAGLNVADKVSQWADSIARLIATAVVIAAVGIFAAFDPGLYRNGALQLIPEQRRKQAQELLDALGTSLQWWLIGQLLPMTVLGIGTFVSLWIMGIPLAFTLALFTAALLFVPYVGSVIALIPAALVALMQGPLKMAYVIVLYLAVHSFEAYVVTPLAQRRAVRLPPAVTLLMELLMWTVSGVLGVAIATPLAAAGLVLIKTLYLKQPPEQRT